jgi:hypothetical protein
MLWRRGRAYAQDLRERVFAAADVGQHVGGIAEALFVSISYVSKVLTGAFSNHFAPMRQHPEHPNPMLAGRSTPATMSATIRLDARKPPWPPVGQ